MAWFWLVISTIKKVSRMDNLRFFEIYRSSEYLGLLFDGILISAGLRSRPVFLGVALALVLCIGKVLASPDLGSVCGRLCRLHSEHPLIVQLFFIAFGLPAAFGYIWPFWAHALLALTINFSGYFAEIFRSGFASIPVGQREAAAALNLSKKTIFRHIVLPQTVVTMFPSLSSQFIFLFLTTGLISEIGVPDLTHAGVFIDSRTFRSFEVFITLTGLYIVISLMLKSTLQLWFSSTIGKRVSD